MANDFSHHDATAPHDPALSSDDIYAAALATPQLAVYVIGVGQDGEFTFGDANDFVGKIAGKPLDEIRGRTVQAVLPPEVAECITNHLRSVFATGEPLAYQRTLELPTGRVSFQTSLMPILGGSSGTKYVLGLTRDITPETDMFDQAQQQAALLQALGIALTSAVYVLDMDDHSLRFVGGQPTGARFEWRKGAEAVGPTVGEKYFHPEDWPRAQAHWEDLAALQDGEVSTISYRLLAHEGEYRRHLHREIVFKRDGDGKVKFVLGVSQDVSEQDKIEQEARDLSAQMLSLQLEERRRIAQELHDSTGQHLTAAALALSTARLLSSGTRNGSPDFLAAMDEAAQCLRDMQREIRVLSYLLHPSHLQSQQLPKALETFANNFGRRAGLKVSVAVAPGADKIEDDTAVHIFRVCQEALTNIYRHANARKVKIKLEVDASIRLTVKDDGVGFNNSAKEILGLGLPGMHERMTRLGGAMAISSGPGGTTLVATIPLTTRMMTGPRPQSEPS